MKKNSLPFETSVCIIVYDSPIKNENWTVENKKILSNCIPCEFKLSGVSGNNQKFRKSFTLFCQRSKERPTLTKHPPLKMSHLYLIYNAVETKISPFAIFGTNFCPPFGFSHLFSEKKVIYVRPKSSSFRKTFS